VSGVHEVTEFITSGPAQALAGLLGVPDPEADSRARGSWSPAGSRSHLPMAG
jgi:hypothetical protein